MRPQVTLIVEDEHTGARRVEIAARRFSIGRDPSNELVVDDTNLSRRHALVEVFADGVQITDCNSSNGTILNGAPLRAAAALRDGDQLILGGTCEIRVEVRATTPNGLHTAAAHASPLRTTAPQPRSSAPPAARPPVPVRQPHTPNRAPQGSGARATGNLNTPLLAATGVIFILLATATALFIARRADDAPGAASDKQAIVFENELATADAGDAAPGDTSRPDGNATLPANEVEAMDTIAGGATSEVIERHAANVIRRISSDDKPYGFSEKALADVAGKIEAYRGSADIRASLASITRDGRRIAGAARANDMQPALVIYAALAATDGGRGGRDPAAAAVALTSDFAQLRATFGSNDADGTLLLVAAYTDGTGTKKSHPLLATIRRLVVNPTTQRNVWFLRERGGLDDTAYDFVLRFIALGVIAQHPQDYNINAAPLAF